MNSLHLFAGIGGGVLADLALGNNVVGAVEIDKFCRDVLTARMKDGNLPFFPLFEDARTFKGNEINETIDLICGGFPCQDISVAGSGKGLNGSKSGLFFELARICRRIRPEYVFLENSPAIIFRGLDTVLGTFAALGYDAQWRCLSARDVGAQHKRDRWWGLFKKRNVSDADETREQQSTGSFRDVRNGTGDILSALSDAESARQMELRGKRLAQASFARPEYVRATFPESGRIGDGRLADVEACFRRTEPDVCRALNGVPDRVDRIAALGNAQVPLQAAVAFATLYEKFNCLEKRI